MTTDPKKCVILVPVGGHIEAACEESLDLLKERGYTVRRVRGYADINQGRSQMATDALADGFDELMWIDSDVAFHPDDVDKLRNHKLPFVCGIYAKKGPREVAAAVLPGTTQLQFGFDGGLREIRYAGFGFVLTRRELFTTMQEKLKLPVCNPMFPRTIVPYFLGLLHETPHGLWYLGEDYAFCERAYQSGYRLFADTSIRLWHIGSYT